MILYIIWLVLNISTWVIFVCETFTLLLEAKYAIGYCHISKIKKYILIQRTGALLGINNHVMYDMLLISVFCMLTI